MKLVVGNGVFSDWHTLVRMVVRLAWPMGTLYTYTHASEFSLGSVETIDCHYA